MKENKEWKERISYCITENGIYVGSSINLPFVIQGKNLNMMKERTRGLLKAYIKDLQRTLDNDLFEYIEQSVSNIK